MDAFTKGKPSYLCGTLGPIVLQDFWTAKTLHTFLNVVSKNGGGALYQTMLLFLYSSLGNRTSKSHHLCVGENKNIENREANHVDLLQLWIQQQRGSVNGVDRGYKFPLASCQESIF
jgi:hypothetical protein